MCSLYETEKDGTEWLYPEAFHKFLCMQAVSLFDVNRKENVNVYIYFKYAFMFKENELL